MVSSSFRSIRFGTVTTQKRRFPLASIRNLSELHVAQRLARRGCLMSRLAYGSRNSSYPLVMNAFKRSMSVRRVVSSSPSSGIHVKTTRRCVSLLLVSMHCPSRKSTAPFAVSMSAICRKNDVLPVPCAAHKHKNTIATLRIAMRVVQQINALQEPLTYQLAGKRIV